MSDGILFLGYGYVAGRLVQRLGGRPRAAAVRSPENRAKPDRDGVTAFAWERAGIDPAAFEGISAALVSTPPGEAGCPALIAAGDALARIADRLCWVGYLSATSVYGDAGGGWVTEDSPTRPDTDRGRARLAAEDGWRALAAAHRLPLVIFRIAGIYGPGRSALDSVRAGTAQRIDRPGHVVNRIHVDDIVAALAASLDNPRAGALFNLADDCPAPGHEVVAYACSLLGREPPPLIPLEAADLSPMALSFYTDNKRVANARLKERLGVALRYPTYREGLAALL